jgi:ABC-type glycerol-3-phosphate transport system substrate-binding protein
MLFLLVLASLLLTAGCGQAVSPRTTQVAKTAQSSEDAPSGEAPEAHPATRTPDRSTDTKTATPLASPTPTSSITVSAEALRGTVIEFWHPYSQEAQVLLDLMTQEFNKTNPWGIQVENRALPGISVLQDVLLEAAQNGTLPDVWTTPTYQALKLDADGRVVADLKPYIEHPEFGLTQEMVRDFLPALWAQEHIPPQALKGRADPQGKRIALPWVRSAALLVYNRTWASELGFSAAPESTTGFRDQACAAARANNNDRILSNDHTGGWMVSGQPAELGGWLAAYGAEIVREDGRGYQFDTPEAEAAVEFLLSLGAQGCIWQTFDANPLEALADRRALFYTASLVELPLIEAGLALAGSEDELQVLPFPSPVDRPAVASYGLSLALSQSEPERQLAGWLFMRWLVSPANQGRWAQFNYLLPTRRSALDGLQTEALQNQYWVAALAFQPYLSPEPYYASWQNVRWALGDAMLQIASPLLQPIEAVEILRMLDELAAEIQLQIR